MTNIETIMLNVNYAASLKPIIALASKLLSNDMMSFQGQFCRKSPMSTIHVANFSRMFSQIFYFYIRIIKIIRMYRMYIVNQ